MAKWPEWHYFGKIYSKLCVLAKMALVWQKILKTVVLRTMAFSLAKDAQNSGFGENGLFLVKALEDSDFAQNCLNLGNAAQNCVIWPKIALVWRRPAQNRFFRQKWLDFRKSCSKWQNGQNSIILAKSTQNCVFWPKWLYFGKIF